MSIFLCKCTNELEQPTALLTQVLKFYEDLDQSQITAFALSASDSNITYIYFNAVEGATNFQYFQTNSFSKVPTNLDNYNVKDFELQDVPGSNLKRFVRTETFDVHSIITYQANGIFYKSHPVEIKWRRQGTDYTGFININQTESLKPIFTWDASEFSTTYLQIVSDEMNSFLSGTFTEQTQFQYGSMDNVLSTVHAETPPDLVLDENYSITVFFIDEDFWVTSISQAFFTAR